MRALPLCSAIALLAVAACAPSGEILARQERCIETRQIATYAMLSDRTVALGDKEGRTLAEVDAPSAGYAGLRLIRLSPERSFAVVSPDGRLCDTWPNQARLRYGEREVQIARVQFTRPAPLGFGSPGVPFASR